MLTCTGLLFRAHFFLIQKIAVSEENTLDCTKLLQETFRTIHAERVFLSDISE
jgi:hypothetical protein